MILVFLEEYFCVLLLFLGLRSLISDSISISIFNIIINTCALYMRYLFMHSLYALFTQALYMRSFYALFIYTAYMCSLNGIFCAFSIWTFFIPLLYGCDHLPQLINLQWKKRLQTEKTAVNDIDRTKATECCCCTNNHAVVGQWFW